MPYDEPDPQDPNMLVGVSVPADRASVVEMAYAFAEEFASLGWHGERLMALFSNPHYAGPHRAYGILGEQEVASIVAESVEHWGRVSAAVVDAKPRSFEGGQPDSRTEEGD